MNQCNGIIARKDSPNYGKQCSLKTDEMYCEYHVWQRNVKEYCITRLEIYLQNVDLAKWRKDKIKICDELFTFLIYNKEFLHQQTNLKNITHAKLEELKNNLPKAEYFMKELFDNH